MQPRFLQAMEIRRRHHGVLCGRRMQVAFEEERTPKGAGDDREGCRGPNPIFLYIVYYTA